eukprot:CCRYP_004074-RA/>CCRYP_004074-RA protein AED:0.50 eAED:0.75 QI:0/0/0/1/0/0/2/0/95
MGYYTIRLDLDSSKICTLTFPWGKYSYLRLPMGITGSPDIFQAEMTSLMVALEFAGLQINTPKLSFCVETEYLGYALTHTGIKPQQNKEQAILVI